MDFKIARYFDNPPALLERKALEISTLSELAALVVKERELGHVVTVYFEKDDKSMIPFSFTGGISVYGCQNVPIEN